jgi:hypothetical protein
MNDVFQLRGEQLEWREIEGEIVALDGRAAEYLAVNRTGAVLWPCLLAGSTREELVARLTESFDVDEASAERDVDAFLETLRERGLLEQ